MKDVQNVEDREVQDAEDWEAQKLRTLKKLRLIDDSFMTKCFEGDLECTELLIRIILKKADLIVKEVHTQEFWENLTGRSVRLDILATDSKGRKYNIEVQRPEKGADPRRARYHCSVIDIDSLEKGADFRDLPEVWVIFITENDVFREGAPLYQVERCFVGKNKLFHDGSHIVYVNGACQDDTELGKLMHDFFCADPDDMYYEVLAKRARYFKQTEKGVAIMCQAMDELFQYGRKEGIEEGIKKGEKRGIKKGEKRGIEKGVAMQKIEFAREMLKMGEPTEKIRHLTKLPIEEIERLRASTFPQ